MTSPLLETLYWLIPFNRMSSHTLHGTPVPTYPLNPMKPRPGHSRSFTSTWKQMLQFHDFESAIKTGLLHHQRKPKHYRFCTHSSMSYLNSPMESWGSFLTLKSWACQYVMPYMYDYRLLYMATEDRNCLHFIFTSLAHSRYLNLNNVLGRKILSLKSDPICVSCV